MKNLLLYGMGLLFSFAMVTSAFAGNDNTNAAKQTTATKDKKACKGKCTKKCCQKSSTTKS